LRLDFARAIKDASGFMPGNLHRDSFIDASANHVSNTVRLKSWKSFPFRLASLQESVKKGPKAPVILGRGMIACNTPVLPRVVGY
jgi:hypothetical protein